MAQDTGPVYQQFETVTVAGTVQVLTAAEYGTLTHALVTAETAACRFTVDGTTPVAVTTGHLLSPGDVLLLTNNSQIKNFKAIRESGTSAVLQVSYGS